MSTKGVKQERNHGFASKLRKKCLFEFSLNDFL